MAMGALDNTGLAYFWQAIKSKLNTKADLVNGKVPSSQLPAGGGGGTSLPSVTSADNGDVLTVVDGAWDKAEREKDVFWVDGVLNLATMTVSNLTKTYAEIVSAFQNNKIVKNRFFYYFSPDLPQTATGDLRIVDTNNEFVNFDALMLANLDGTNRLYHLVMVINSSNAVTTGIRVVSSTQIGA